MKVLIIITLGLISFSFRAQDIFERINNDITGNRFFLEASRNNANIGMQKNFPLEPYNHHHRERYGYYIRGSIGTMTNPKNSFYVVQNVVNGDDTTKVEGFIDTYDNHFTVSGGTGLFLLHGLTVWSLGMGHSYSDRIQKIRIGDIQKYNSEFTNDTDIVTLKTKELDVFINFTLNIYVHSKVFLGFGADVGRRSVLSINKMTSIPDLDEGRFYFSPRFRLGLVF